MFSKSEIEPDFLQLIEAWPSLPEHIKAAIKALSRQICEYHWRRHLDEKDGFDLFEAFNFQRPARMLLGLVYDLAGVGHSNQPREAERAARNVLNQPLDAGFIASRQVHRLVDAENSGFTGANLAATAAL